MKNKNTVRFISILLSLILLLFSWTETAYAADLPGLTTESTSADTLEDISADISDNSITATANEIFTDIPDNSITDISNNTLFDNLYENTIYSSESFPEDLLPMELEYIPYSQAMAYFEPIETAKSDSAVNLFSSKTTVTENPITDNTIADASAAESFDSINRISSSSDFAESTEQLLTSQSYESSWEQYGCYYIYNKLSDEDKLVWDKLSELCITILDSTDKKSNTGIVSYGSTDFTHLKSVAYMFRYSNPQYFFLKNSVVYTKKTVDNEMTYYVGLGIYDAFQDGAARKEAAEAFFAQLDSWTVQVEALDTELEKVLTIQNLICEKVEYDSEFASSSNAEQLEQEKTKFTQSAYSTLCMDKTVCAGYAQGFELLANAVGIDTIAVTSRGHEWNQVRINDSWYNLDCTWADKSTYVWQKYTLKSNEFYENDNSSHIMASFWNGYTPPCSRDSSFSGTSLPGVIPEGTLPEPLGKLDVPAITSSGYGGECTITVSSNQADAEIYYTVNASAPSSSFTKSMRYEGAFTVNSGDRISAVAVKDCYNDSETVSLEAAPTGYLIFYHLDGGINDADNPDCYSLGQSGVISLKAPVKTGYHFLGWYLDPDLTEAVTEICPPVTRNIELYAAWEIDTFEVVTDYNGSGINKTEIYEYGSKIPEKEDVWKSGYRFLGWYLVTETETRLWDFSKDIVSGDMTLKAFFQKVCQVTYVSESGEVPGIQTVDEGTLLSEPEINRKGYTLTGWYPQNQDTPWDFSKDVVTEDLTLEARWEPQHYQVTFDAGEGECSFTEKEVIYGQPYGELPDAVYEGHIFDGWYCPDLNQRVEEDTTVSMTEGHELTARWITMDTCSGPQANIASGEIYYGTKLILTSKTEGADIYYTLDGSTPCRDNGILYNAAIELTEDVVVRAVAVKKNYMDSYISEFSYRMIPYRCDAGEITQEDLQEYAKKQGLDVHTLTDDMLPRGLWAAGLTDQVYTGTRVTCPQLHVYYGTKLLTCGEDYTLRYSSNLNAGKARVLIKGKGNYKGSLREYFTILPADIQNAEAKDIVLFYTAKMQKGKPEVYSMLNGKKVKLKAGKDFVYEYPAADPEKDNYDETAFNNAGSYTILIQGKGNYQGTLPVTETIRRPNLPRAAENAVTNLKPQPITKAMVVGWIKSILKYIHV